MRKLTYILLVILFTHNSLSAQGPNHEKIKAFKTAYITQKLDLTPKEAEKFWPVYNNYEKKINQLRVKNIRGKYIEIKNKGGFNALNDKESEYYLDGLIQNDQDLLQTKKEFYADLKNVISSKKILLLYRAENEFNRKLLEEFRRKRGKGM